MTHQNLRLGKCWGLFWATLKRWQKQTKRRVPQFHAKNDLQNSTEESKTASAFSLIILPFHLYTRMWENGKQLIFFTVDCKTTNYSFTKLDYGKKPCFVLIDFLKSPSSCLFSTRLRRSLGRFVTSKKGASRPNILYLKFVRSTGLKSIFVLLVPYWEK